MEFVFHWKHLFKNAEKRITGFSLSKRTLTLSLILLKSSKSILTSIHLKLKNLFCSKRSCIQLMKFEIDQWPSTMNSLLKFLMIICITLLSQTKDILQKFKLKMILREGINNLISMEKSTNEDCFLVID